MNERELEEFKKELKLSKKQREILVGILLGDACLETSNRGHTYRLKIEQSETHREYVYHLYELFKEWVLTPPQEKVVVLGDHKSMNLAFSTVSHAAFRFYAHQFYGKQGNKKVPKLIHRWLTPVNLAYWYMDEGLIKSKESKGVILKTHSCSRSEVNRLAQAIASVFGLQAKARKQKEKYQIYISEDSCERFFDLIKPYVLESMQDKIPHSRRTQLPKE